MPLMKDVTRREREEIEGVVRSFLARFIQVTKLLDDDLWLGGPASAKVARLGSDALNDLWEWQASIVVVLTQVDRDIAEGAWRATAHRLIRRPVWQQVAAILDVDTVNEAKAIVLRTTARVYAEVIARDLQEVSLAQAA